MDEVIGLIAELARAVREIHQQSSPDNFKARQLSESLDLLVTRAEQLLRSKTG